MSKPRLLDLFCGAGGCSVGYKRAGFDVVGVDLADQPYYPFEFIRADALTFPLDGFDAIHASPPCQAYTSMRHMGKRAGEGAIELIEPVLARLEASGVPWVIENVVGAPVPNPLRLCGSSFDLEVRRHRLFGSSHLIFGVRCEHAKHPEPIAVYGDHPENSRGTKRVRRARTLSEGQKAMGIDWMPWRPLTQAIPPAYTEWIGRQLLASLKSAA